jgi:hypothetical protein
MWKLPISWLLMPKALCMGKPAAMCPSGSESKKTDKKEARLTKSNGLLFYSIG